MICEAIEIMVFMDPMNSRGADVVLDLESGTDSSVRSTRTLFNKVCSRISSSDGSIQGQETVNLANQFSASNDGSIQREEASMGIESSGVEKVGLLAKKAVPENPKKKSNKKPPKPPRPPKSLVMDAADQKLAQGISELMVLKRARKERMKALKKMKNAKATSPNANLCSLVVTVIFCLVVIWQGVFCRGSSSVTLRGSPEPSPGLSEGLISVQFYKNGLTDGPHGSNSASPNNAQQVSGLDERRKARRLAG